MARIGRARLHAVGVAGLLALIASASGVQAAERVNVGQSIASCICFLPMHVAQKIGIWKKYGLDVHIAVLRGDAQLQQALASGAIDIGVGGGPGIGMLAKGVPAKAIAATAGSPGDMGLIVAAHSPITSVDKLKGKRVGVSSAGSLTYWLAKKIAQKKGWPSSDIHTVALGDFASNVAGLKSGAVDAIIFGVEAGYQLENKKEGRLLMNFAGIVPNFESHVAFASDAVIKTRPDVVRKFLQGWFETVRWMTKHKNQSVAIAAAYTKFPAPVMSKTFDNVMPTMSRTGRFDPKALKVLSKSFVELGIVSKTPDMSKLIDTQFLPKTK
ncbi:MAG TPA: ABC transporter substrate-binding protein [Beijerinckiaceae bacterium]|nr:ABC transporter substrate-binding protein [Beijerinckiaceae bacterium]